MNSACIQITSYIQAYIQRFYQHLWKGTLVSILFFLTLDCSKILAQKKVFLNVARSWERNLKLPLLPDFSHVGFLGGNDTIPSIPVRAVVYPIDGDATSLIQKAIDSVSTLAVLPSGFRGAVLLMPGIYRVNQQLLLHHSGVVLRGAGAWGKTIIAGTGFSRDNLIQIGLPGNYPAHRPLILDSIPVPVTAKQFTTLGYFPSGGHRISIEKAQAKKLKEGQQVFLDMPISKQLIDTLRTNGFGGGLTALGWKPGDFSIRWDRTILKLDFSSPSDSMVWVELDAPITAPALLGLSNFFLLPYQWPNRVSHVGIEQLELWGELKDASSSFYSIGAETNVATYKDGREDSRWTAIGIENARDGFIRRVQFKYFIGSAVSLLNTSSRFTMRELVSITPKGEIGGGRRQTYFVEGQQHLLLKCYAENGVHDFSTGTTAAGPNAFVQCVANNANSFSGGIGALSSATLFDGIRVDGQAIRLGWLGFEKAGAGWNAWNSMLWNCTAALIQCDAPILTNNFSFGSWAEFSGNGYWAESNNTLSPSSFFALQWKERVPFHKEIDAYLKLLPSLSDASSSPTIEVAAQLSEAAEKAAPSLKSWIQADADEQGERLLEELPEILSLLHKEQKAGLKIKNSPQKKTDKIIHQKQSSTYSLQSVEQFTTGKRWSITWWNGNLRDRYIAQAKPHLTRFVPSKTGTGFTDQIDSVVANMKAQGAVLFEHHYGLWYDRRRDDHERIKRINGDVWMPFYELPFARSGNGTAYDGLSKYDLTQPNEFFYYRLQQFLKKSAPEGIYLFHQHYFQHNILEAGAHYADFPWRTANNINQTPFPEPVFYAGDKRVFMAKQFYNLQDSSYRALHQQYIHQVLDRLDHYPNTIHSLSEEYTGPTEFYSFWLKTIQDYRNKKQQISPFSLSNSSPTKRAQVVLGCTKDVQDQILRDSSLLDLIDIIDIRYWYYQGNGQLYTPEGDQQLAPRQHARLLKPKSSSLPMVYRAVWEMKSRFPQKKIMYSADGFDRFGWAVFMAGGSFASLPFDWRKINLPIRSDQFFQPIISSKEEPWNAPYWILQSKNQSIIVWQNANSSTFQWKTTSTAKKWSVYYVDPNNGSVIKGTPIAVASDSGIISCATQPPQNGGIKDKKIHPNGLLEEEKIAPQKKYILVLIPEPESSAPSIKYR